MGTGPREGTGEATGLTTVEASLLAGVSEKTIRNWVKAGFIPMERAPHGRRIPRGPLLDYLRERALTAVERVPPEARPEESTGSATNSAPEPVRERLPDPLEARFRVAPADVERAVERTAAQYMGDLRTVLAEVGKVYEGQLAAKDETIATQRDALAELRRRAEGAEAERQAAEEERDALRLRLAEASVPPVGVVAGPGAPEAPYTTTTTPAAHEGVAGLWRRLRRVLTRA